MIQQMTLYHASWCPHSKKAKAEWDVFVQTQQYRTQAQQQTGLLPSFVDIVCDHVDKAWLDQIGITGYPTCVIYMNTQPIEYKGLITKDGLELVYQTLKQIE